MESRVISALDGVLNPKTFEITEHSPDYLTTTKLPFNFKSDSNNNKLWNHILTIIDPEDINKKINKALNQDSKINIFESKVNGQREIVGKNFFIN